jgi:flagellar motor switch protein FliN
MSSLPNSSFNSDLSSPHFRQFHDVLCGIDIVLGRGTMTVRECLQLKRHAVIRLMETAGSDLQVLANGVPIALGEVVIVDDTTAIRVTEILPPAGADQPS